MAGKLWAAFKRALSLDSLVQLAVGAAITTIVVSIVGTVTRMPLPYLATLSVGVFLLVMSPLLALSRVSRYDRPAPVQRLSAASLEPPLPAPPPEEPPLPEWIPLIVASGPVIALVLESDDGRARFFGCDVRDPHGEWAGADVNLSEKWTGPNSEFRSQVQVHYPDHFPNAPRLPLDDGTYLVRWYRLMGAGREELARTSFRLVQGKVILD